MDAEVLYIHTALEEVEGELSVSSEYLHGLFDVEGDLDLSCLADLEDIVASEDVER